MPVSIQPSVVAAGTSVSTNWGVIRSVYVTRGRYVLSRLTLVSQGDKATARPDQPGAQTGGEDEQRSGCEQRTAWH